MVLHSRSQVEDRDDPDRAVAVFFWFTEREELDLKVTEAQMLARLQDFEDLVEAGKVLSSANQALVQQIFDSSQNLPSGAGQSQIQSLAKQLLKQTSPDGGDDADGDGDKEGGSLVGMTDFGKGAAIAQPTNDPSADSTDPVKEADSHVNGDAAPADEGDDDPAQRLAKTKAEADKNGTAVDPDPGNKMMEAERRVYEADISMDDRMAAAKEGKALPDGSYPMRDKGELHSAIVLAQSGHGDVKGAKDLIKKRAAELDATDMLPKEMQESVQAEADLSSDVQIIEAVSGMQGKEWDVMLISEGLSKNGKYYPASTLKESAPLFERAFAFADHSSVSERRERPERSIRDRVGWFSNVHYDKANIGGHVVEGLRARFHLVDQQLRTALLEATEMGRPDFMGFSIDAAGKIANRKMGSKVVNVVESISKVYSVDMVTEPAAGGQFVRLVASNDPHQTEEYTELDLKEAVAQAMAEERAKAGDSELAKQVLELKEALARQDAEKRVDAKLSTVNISDLGKERIREAFVGMVGRRDFTAEELEAEVTRTANYEAAILSKSSPQLAIPGRYRESIAVGDNMHDKYDKALQGLFDNADIDGIPRFRSMKEAYCRWMGRDVWDLTAQEFVRETIGDAKYDSAVDHKRVRESLSTSSWSNVYADHLYLKLMRDYATLPYTTMWQAICSEIEDVPDFQTRHWDVVGGYSDLTTVAEQGTYPQLTSPSDQEVTYSISKRGGLDDVTFEAIVNDRVGAIRRIPTHMARSAARTLFKFVMNKVTTDNPTMPYDSVALYNSGHNNLGTTALSLAGLNATVVAMRNQTAFGESSEILGVRNKPKYLIVPNTLEQAANRILDPSGSYYIGVTADTDGSIDPQAFKGAGISTLVYDQLTDTNDWFAIADPGQVETLVVGFLNGQRDPELFVQDTPNVGSVFSSDKITYKIRHIYGAAILDHRSFYQQHV